MKQELWMTEKQSEDLALSFRIKKTLHEEQTPYQHLALVETEECGRMLFLDGCVMTSIKDEFVYHEMISQVPLNTHPHPEHVLVIGGGDGGAIREIVKHPRVKTATLVEIDGRVVETSREYLPEIAAGLDDPKVKVIIDDGIKHIRDNKNKYDVILIDSTDPIGPAVGLFAVDFYRDVYAALREEGVMVAQTESPFMQQKLITQVNQDLKTLFPLVKLYLAFIPTYPTGMWSFTLASKKHDPQAVQPQAIADTQTRYYNKEVHYAAFALPSFTAELVK